MSQLDIIHYTPTLIWVLFCFLYFFFLVNSSFLLIMHINLRVRYMFKNKIENSIINKINSFFYVNVLFFKKKYIKKSFILKCQFYELLYF